MTAPENVSSDRRGIEQELESLPDRFEVNPSFVLVQERENQIQFRAGPWSGPVFKLRNSDEDGQMDQIVGLFTGRVSLEQLSKNLEDSEVKGLIALLKKLLGNNLLLPADVSEQSETSKGYLSLVDGLDRFGPLTEASVTVVSDGPLGTMVAEDLVVYDVDEIKAIDIDGDGEYPSEVTKADVDEVEDCVDDVNLIVYVTDTPHPDLADRLNRLATERDTDLLVGQLQGFDGFVGPTIVPGKSPCYQCFKDRMYANVDYLSGYEGYEQISQKSKIGSLPNFARVISGMVSTEAITHLNRGVGMTVGGIVHFDFFDLSVEANDVLKSPRCDVCGAEAMVDDHQEHITFSDLIEEATVGTDDAI